LYNSFQRPKSSSKEMATNDIESSISWSELTVGIVRRWSCKICCNNETKGN